MGIIRKTDVLEKIVNLAALTSSFFGNDMELAQEIKRNLELGKITDNQINEIIRIVEQADRGGTSTSTFTSIIKGQNKK